MAVDKNKIRKKAAQKAAQKYAAEKARQRQAAADAKDTYHEGVDAAKGLKHLVVDAKKAQLAGLDETGISGLAKQQLIDQLEQGIDSAGNIVPVERATLRPELQDTLSDIRDNLFSLKQSQENAQESYYNSILSRRRALEKKRNQRERAKVQRVKEHRADKREKATDFNQQVNAQLSTIRDAVYQDAVKQSAEGQSVDRKAAFQTAATRLANDPASFKSFVDHYSTTAEGSHKATRKALSAFVRKYALEDPLGLID